MVTVARINVTPVKSLRLHHPEAVELGNDGAFDEITGRSVREEMFIDLEHGVEEIWLAGADRRGLVDP